ncbi:MAG: hypothetical protein ACRDYU_12675 [Actinomycetes bacterium]
MSVEDHEPETLSGGGADSPASLARERRLWLALTALVLAAVAVGLLVAQQAGKPAEQTAPQTIELPPEPVGTFLLLDPRHGTEGRASLHGRPAVVEIECVGPGQVLVRLNARSWVTQGCVAGELRRAERTVTAMALDKLDPQLSGHVWVTVSTVGITGASRWRVTLHPPVEAPA